MKDKPDGTAKEEYGASDAGSPAPPTLPNEQSSAAGGQGPHERGYIHSPKPPSSPPSRWERFRHWLVTPEGSGVLMVVFTAVIAATGIIGAILIYQGGADTKTIANAAQKQVAAADRSVAAAQQFADTAGDINSSIDDAVGKLDAQAKASAASIKATQDAMRLDQRAWVGVLAEMDKPVVGKPLIGKALLTNSGKTFAVSMTIQNHLATSAAKLVTMPSVPPLTKDESVGLLVPNRPYESHVTFRDASGAPINANQQDIDNLTTGGYYIYVFGEVHYDDVFKRPHETDFCWYRRGAEEVEFTQCAIHNTAN